MGGLDDLGGGGAAAFSNPGPIQGLLLYFVTRWMLLTTCFLLPMPFGTFAPCMMLGGCLGRLFGELAASLGSFDLVGWDENPAPFRFYPAIFSICGSAAYNAGLAKNFSVTIFMLEMTGQFQLTIPCMVAGVAAFLTQFYLSDSFYDMMCRTRALSWVPPVPDYKRNIPVGVFMTVSPAVVYQRSSARDVLDVLRGCVAQRYFPVLDCEARRHPMGYATRRDLLAYVVAGAEGETHDDRLASVRDLLHVHDSDLPNQGHRAVSFVRRMFRGQPPPKKLPWRPSPVLLSPSSPLHLLYDLITRQEQSVVLMAGADGSLAGMITREQAIIAIGYRTYFRVLRICAERTLMILTRAAV